MLFKQAFNVDHLNYSSDTSVILFHVVYYYYVQFVDALESKGTLACKH